MTIDFGQESCSNGHTVSLNQNKIVIIGNEIVTFGRPFKDIVLAMSNCNDQVTIAKTYSDTSSILKSLDMTGTTESNSEIRLRD